MAKSRGPTIARWRLGEELARLREGAGLTYLDVAKKLKCSDSKIRKIEGGNVSVQVKELQTMLSLYHVADDETQTDLLDLQRQGKQRGWWSKFGQLSGNLTTFLGLESAATTIQTYEAMVIPGLLQTDDYAQAIAMTPTGNITPAQAQREMQLRLARQKQVFSDDGPQMWFIIDEGAIRRKIGSGAVMRAQLQHLLELPSTNGCTLQVAPLDGGAYPGTLGSFVILSFPEDVHTPVVYVEGQAGNLYLERPEDLARCTLVYNQMTAAALSVTESADLIQAILKEYE